MSNECQLPDEPRYRTLRFSATQPTNWLRLSRAKIQATPIEARADPSKKAAKLTYQAAPSPRATNDPTPKRATRDKAAMRSRSATRTWARHWWQYGMSHAQPRVLEFRFRSVPLMVSQVPGKRPQQAHCRGKANCLPETSTLILRQSRTQMSRQILIIKPNKDRTKKCPSQRGARGQNSGLPNRQPRNSRFTMRSMRRSTVGLNRANVGARSGARREITRST